MPQIQGIAEIDAQGVLHVDPADATYTEISIEAMEVVAANFKAIERVRECIASYERDSQVKTSSPMTRSMYKVIAQELNEALDGVE